MTMPRRRLLPGLAACTTAVLFACASMGTDPGPGGPQPQPWLDSEWWWLVEEAVNAANFSHALGVLSPARGGGGGDKMGAEAASSAGYVVSAALRWEDELARPDPLLWAVIEQVVRAGARLSPETTGLLAAAAVTNDRTACLRMLLQDMGLCPAAAAQQHGGPAAAAASWKDSREAIPLSSFGGFEEFESGAGGGTEPLLSLAVRPAALYPGAMPHARPGWTPIIIYVMMGRGGTGGTPGTGGGGGGGAATKAELLDAVVARVAAGLGASAGDRTRLALAASPTLVELALKLSRRPRDSPLTVPLATYAAVADEAVLPMVDTLLAAPAPCLAGLLEERDHRLGRTPLHIAAETGLRGVAAKLLAAGADPTAADRFGWTPAHLAAKGGFSELARSLGAGAAPVDFLGRSAADLLKMYGDGEDDVQGACAAGGDCGASVRGAGEDEEDKDGHWASEGTASGPGPGGWPATEAHTLGRGVSGPECDIPVLDAGIDDLSRVFWDHYISIGQPVLIRGGASAWAFRRWTPEHVKQHLGAAEFTVSTVPYADVYGGGARNSSTVAQFVDRILQTGGGPTSGARAGTARPGCSDAGAGTDGGARCTLAPYIFSEIPDAHLDLFGPYLADVEGMAGNLFASRPTSVQFKRPQFFVGPAASAAPMHFHEDAINALAFGRKRWALVPPHRAEFSTVPGLQWFDAAVGLGGGNGTGKGSGGVLQCVQEAGDIMYVPHGWGHAVLNTMASIGLATNFEQPLRSY